MIKKILSGYATLFKTLVIVVLLSAVCFATGILIVWPLWKLADSHPNLYTIVFTSCFTLIVLWIVGTRMHISFKKNPRSFLFSILRKLTLLCGACLIITLILTWHRSAAFFALCGTVALYGFLAFVISPNLPKG